MVNGIWTKEELEIMDRVDFENDSDILTTLADLSMSKLFDDYSSTKIYLAYLDLVGQLDQVFFEVSCGPDWEGGEAPKGKGTYLGCFYLDRSGSTYEWAFPSNRYSSKSWVEELMRDFLLEYICRSTRTDPNFTLMNSKIIKIFKPIIEKIKVIYVGYAQGLK